MLHQRCSAVTPHLDVMKIFLRVGWLGIMAGCWTCNQQVASSFNSRPLHFQGAILGKSFTRASDTNQYHLYQPKGPDALQLGRYNCGPDEN